jgi:hypothetical protein
VEGGMMEFTARIREPAIDVIDVVVFAVFQDFGVVLTFSGLVSVMGCSSNHASFAVLLQRSYS